MRINAKLVASLLQAMSIWLLVLLIYRVGFENLQSNVIWVAYSIFLVLTLPALISKGFFGAPFISFTAAVCYLYYPLAYLILFGVSNLFDVNFSSLTFAFAIFTIFYWNYLLAFLTFKLKEKYIESLVKNSFYVLVPVVIFILFSIVFIRQPSSVLATDYIQHQTVATVMNEREQFCLIPNDCSNLFLQVGYTTFYHFILGTIGIFNGNDLSVVLYILDFVWTAVIAVVIYKFMLSRLNHYIFASIGVFFSLIIFINGAYDTQFFLPQTLSLLLFLNIISSEKLSF